MFTFGITSYKTANDAIKQAITPNKDNLLHLDMQQLFCLIHTFYFNCLSFSKRGKYNLQETEVLGKFKLNKMQDK